MASVTDEANVGLHFLSQFVEVVWESVEKMCGGKGV